MYIAKRFCICRFSLSTFAGGWFGLLKVVIYEYLFFSAMFTIVLLSLKAGEIANVS